MKGVRNYFFLFIIYHFFTGAAFSQDVINEALIQSDTVMLLENALIQMEATSAVNDMYNFKFRRATNQFQWFQEKYPHHPLPYFLLGLNTWWQMMPNMEVKIHDEAFFNYMDQSIEKARVLYKQNEENMEASFFLAAAYAFKSRLHSERKHWTKATFAGKSALRYLKHSREVNELSPEFMLGDALYNYYSVWIPENYPLLRPILMFFKKGDQELGLKQLHKVAHNAFYTRTEAQYFLMRIYRNEEKKPAKAYPIAKYLHETFPDNAYFHRYYASIAFSLSKFNEMEKASLDILEKINSKMPGYEGISGRYASYFLGYVYRVRYKDFEKVKKYYRQTISFAEGTKSFSSGYYQSALLHLARIAHKAEEYKIAKKYYKTLKKHTKKKNKKHKEAKKYLRKYKKIKG